MPKITVLRDKHGYSHLSLLLNSLSLFKYIYGFSNLLIQVGEIIEEFLDLTMWKIKQHACDLPGHCVSHEFLNIAVDELSYHFLEVKVLRNYGRDQQEALFVEIIYCWVRVEKMLSIRHFWYYWSWLYSWWILILHRIKHRLVILTIVSHNSHWGRRGVSLAPIVVILMVLTTIIIEITASLAPIIIIIILVSHLRFHLILHDKEDLLNQLNDVWFLENTQIGWHALCVQPSLIVEISLIFLFIDLPVANFRNLIVSHVEQSPI